MRIPELPLLFHLACLMRLAMSALCIYMSQEGIDFRPATSVIYLRDLCSMQRLKQIVTRKT